MLDHAREAVEMARDRRQGDLDADRQLELSLTRLVEIVGEAAGAFPRRAASSIPTYPGARLSGCAAG